jgi:hypothetical protein
MKNHKARTRERAESMFIVYWRMGRERSLENLAKLCNALGVKISLNTLSNYSRDYEWQRRLLERETCDKQQIESEIIAQVGVMNQQHIELARSILNIVSGGIQKYLDELKQKQERGEPETLDISPLELVRLLEGAQKIERLARGEAITIADLKIQVIGDLVRQIALIFMSVNDLPTPEDRKREFIRKCDDILRPIYKEVKTVEENNY